MPTVECGTHGTQQQTWVCQHIAQGMIERQRVGFCWSIENPSNPRPDAWCSACNERVEATDGEWVGEAADHAQPKVLCGACYDVAKSFHMGGDPWS